MANQIHIKSSNKNKLPSNPTDSSSAAKIWIKFGLPIILLGTLVIGGTLFSMSKNKPAELPAKHQIVVGMSPWAGNLGFYIAEKKGYFKELGLDVKLKNFSSLSDAKVDYRQDKVHILSTLNLDAIQLANDGVDHRIIAVQDKSYGADGIIAQSSITSLAQIKSKKVAYEKGTLEEFFLKYALNQYNMTLNDVQGIDLAPDKAAEALTNKQVDVAVTYEPYLSEALDGKSNLLYSTKTAPDLIYDLVVAKTTYIGKNSEDIQNLLKAYFMAIDYWRSDPADAAKIVATYMNTTPQDVSSQLDKLSILDLRSNEAVFTYSSDLESIYGNLRQLSAEFELLDNTNIAASDRLAYPLFIETLSED